MRVQIFIDGGNFHHLALRPLGIKETDFDFDAFAEFVADGRGLPIWARDTTLGLSANEKEISAVRARWQSKYSF